MRISLAFGLVLSGVYVVADGSFALGGAEGLFTGLTSSHHAPGLFYGLVGAVLLVIGLREGRRVDVALGLASFIPVMLASSRTGLAGHSQPEC